MKRTGLIVILMTMILAFDVLLIHAADESAEYSLEGLRFSVEEYFLDTATELKILARPGEQIYYTVDGSIPDSRDMLYESPILLRCEEEPMIYTIRAVSYKNGKQSSEVITHSYLTGIGIRDYFDCKITILTTDPENLYNEETGIFANYKMKGSEAEREVYVEILDCDGQELIAQNAGMRVHGGTSRGMEQKSLKLYARSEYGENRFYGKIFEQSESGDYNRLLLRNSANDASGAYVRDELTNALASQANFPATAMSQACAVYLNGEYYGFEWLHSCVDGAALDQFYGIQKNKGEWEIIENREVAVQAEDPEDFYESQAVADYNYLLSFIDRDLTDDAVYTEFRSLVDVDNMLDYYAFEVCSGNSDWPVNNSKVYRWYSYQSSYSEETSDGRWRFLLYDADLTFNASDGSKASSQTIERILSFYDEASSFHSLFGAVMRRDDVKQQFCNNVRNYLEKEFTRENVRRTLEGLLQERDREFQHYLTVCFDEEEREIKMQQIQESIDGILAFPEERRAVLQEQMDRMLDYTW